MKQLWRKYGLAALVTLVLASCLLWLGLTVGTDAANARYYGKWIADEADLLSAETEKQLAQTLQMLDETYGSVMGFVTLSRAEDGNVADQAFALQQSYGFGKNDLMLLILPETQKHYLADGDVIAQYYPNDLRIALQEHISAETFAPGKADASVLAMYDLAARWYEENVPAHMGRQKDRSRSAGGAEVLLTLLLTVVSAFALLCLLRYLIWPLFRYKTLGKWRPLWGWHILGPLKTQKNDR